MDASGPSEGSLGPTPDDVLGIDAQTGAELSLNVVYRHNFDFVWRCLVRFGIHDHEREDVAQEVFLVVQRRLPSFDPAAGTVRGWLYGITRRVAANRRRHSQNRRQHVQRIAESEAERWATRAELHMDNEQRLWLANMHQMVRRLPPEFRDVFILFDLEQMPTQEVCQTLGIGRATAFRRRKAAREQLRAQLEREGVLGAVPMAESNSVHPPRAARARVWAMVSPAGATQLTGASVSASWTSALLGISPTPIKFALVAAALVGSAGSKLGSETTRRPSSQIEPSSPQTRIAAKEIPQNPIGDLEKTIEAASNHTPPRLQSPTQIKTIQSRGPVRSPLEPRSSMPNASNAQRRSHKNPPRPGDPIQVEMRLVREIKAQLRNGRSLAALTTAQRYARAFPAGGFAEDIAVLRIRALCQLRRIAEVQRAKQAFHVRYKKSALAHAVGAICRDER